MLSVSSSDGSRTGFSKLLSLSNEVVFNLVYILDSSGELLQLQASGPPMPHPRSSNSELLWVGSKHS